MSNINILIFWAKYKYFNDINFKFRTIMVIYSISCLKDVYAYHLGNYTIEMTHINSTIYSNIKVLIQSF